MPHTSNAAVQIPQVIQPELTLITGGTTNSTAITTNNITTNNIIWTAWNATYAITSATTTANTIITADTGTSANGVIWTIWNQAYTTTATNVISIHQGAIPQRTPEQVQEDLRRNEQYRQQQVVAEAERAKARERAAKLLHEGLTPKQREEFAQKGHFTLETIAPTGERRVYRISKGRSHNIARVDDNGKVLKTLCAHPIEAVPDEDTMLAQKLWLETREEEFLRIANHSHR